MTISLAIGRRKNWINPERRDRNKYWDEQDKWETVPWWKLEAWFYRGNKDSRWGAGVGWLFFKLRIGGSS